MCFDDDLAFGQEWEKEALKLLEYDTYRTRNQGGVSNLMTLN